MSRKVHIYGYHEDIICGLVRIFPISVKGWITIIVVYKDHLVVEGNNNLSNEGLSRDIFLKEKEQLLSHNMYGKY